MKRLIFLLSGEYPEVSKAEVIGALEAENYNFRIDEELDQVLTVETDAEPSILAERLGLCHWIGKHFATSSPEYIRETISNSDIVDFLPQTETIAFRSKRIKNSLPHLDSQKLSKDIADIILDRFNYEVDLENPEREIYILISDEKCVASTILEKVDRKEIRKREPPKRAAVHPSTLHPFFARAMVNLARTPRDGRFLDPFCGVGGIIMEAGIIGAKVIGVDIKKEQIDGARENLEDHQVKKFELFQADMRELEMEEKVDAIATDPPYGRQASTGGTEMIKIYDESLPVLSRLLKPKRYLCITAPSEIEVTEMSKNLELNLKEKYKDRVHGDLTRMIYVFQKEGIPEGRNSYNPGRSEEKANSI